MYDRAKLRSRLAEEIITIRQWKALRDESGQPSWIGTDAGRSLHNSKFQATLLCALLARTHKRVHLRRFPLVTSHGPLDAEKFEKAVDREGEKFLRVEQAAA